MALQSIIGMGRAVAQDRRERKAERVIYERAGQAYRYLLDTDRHEIRGDAGLSPAGLEDEDYMRRVGTATVELCRIHSFVKDIYVYDHEASVEATREAAQQRKLEGVRVVFRKIVDPLPETGIEIASDYDILG